jgi:hypothetical protein
MACSAKLLAGLISPECFSEISETRSWQSSRDQRNRDFAVALDGICWFGYGTRDLRLGANYQDCVLFSHFTLVGEGGLHFALFVVQ